MVIESTKNREQKQINLQPDISLRNLLNKYVVLYNSRTYVIKPGDTLVQISQKFFGDASRVTEIIDLNPLFRYTNNCEKPIPGCWVPSGSRIFIPDE
ncbi:MAG: LysM peptidoglycan-binding domain-containing protein [Nitrospira sp.]|nr:LysM peptidoglycan-binding domain-containing protein [Nitrospira sp.]